MKIAVGADHAGFDFKEEVIGILKSLGHEVSDVGTFSKDSVDYPDYAKLVAKEVEDQKVDRGILICGTGIGMSIAANKFKHIRAALVTDAFTAKMSRSHNDANILCLGSRVINPEQLANIIATWLSEPFEGGRHKRRVEKMMALENRNDD
ncbi:MAG: ribose 5-phosphate isomerase B [Bdellovibrionales bacterium]|nr:ribose 5-phosphate isomerase B [Bdellovibrionales bacterium]